MGHLPWYEQLYVLAGTVALFGLLYVFAWCVDHLSQWVERRGWQSERSYLDDDVD